MNPDKDLFDLLIELIEKVLGHPVSPQFEKALAAFFILAILAIAANALIMGIKALVNEVVIPVFYNKEQKRRRSRRQLFADHVEAEIRYLNSRESWNDNRFAELEAEVEAEGSRRIFGWIKINFGAGTRLRREKSLSTAISNSAVPLVLLEGDPGSGKSVALRHVAQQMARRAAKSRSLTSIVPLYINLKNLKRGEGQTVDRNFISDFILRSINRVNDRDVDEFLKDEFQMGLEEGSWFFLFDSFDEIPEILSSTESDATIRTYAEAIRDFLHGMNKCKGIVASREYKGPRYLGWPKFRIVPLSVARRSELIRRTNLPTYVQESIYAGISFASVEFRAMTSNPMFLSLLCEFMHKQDAVFPQYTHLVYDEYIWKRLTRDEERLRTRFEKSPEELRSAAEKLAFCMTADPGLGLSPTQGALRSSTEKFGLSLEQHFDVYIEALEYLKMARIDTQVGEGDKQFTFAHRRFQEYFATAIVVKEPWRVTAKELLSNGQWRETAVTLLQTQSADQLLEILEVAEKIFTESLEEIDPEFEKHEFVPHAVTRKKLLLERFGFLSDGLYARILDNSEKTTSWIASIVSEFEEEETEKKRRQERVESYSKPIEWPKGIYHLLSILQDGTSGRPNFLSASFQSLLDRFLLFVSDKGSPDDQKMAVEIAGIASKSSFGQILETGFGSIGTWIRAAAYRQLARLGDVPDEFAVFIRTMLVGMMFNGTLFFERHEIYAQLARLDKSRQFIYTARLLAWMPIIDHLCVGVSLVILLNIPAVFPATSPYVFVFVILFYLALRWYAKPLWQFVWGSSSRYYSSVFSTPVGIAGIVMLYGLMALFSLRYFLVGNIDFDIVFSQFTGITIIPVLLIVSLNVWSTFATVEAIAGKRTHPVWWLLYVLYPLLLIPAFITLLIFQFLSLILVIGDLLFIITRLPVLFIEIRKYSGVNSLGILKYFIARHKSLSFFAQIILWVGGYIILTEVASLDFMLIQFGLIAAMVIMYLLLFSYRAIKSMYIEKVEERRLNKIKLGDSQMQLVDFIAYLTKFSHKSIRLGILKDALNKQIIVPSNSNEAQLRNLISFVQALLLDNQINHYAYLMMLDPVLASSLKLNKNISVLPKTMVWDADQLDALCNLLDQIRTANINQ